MNGTVTMIVGLLAAGVGAGDEVIVPPYTFMATASSVVAVGAASVAGSLVAQVINTATNALASNVTLSSTLATTTTDFTTASNATSISRASR
jgi:dTDP-4-amino-4,6-dideoxygalactose transaminase